MILQFHPALTVEKWRSFSWSKRLLNIGAELQRSKNFIFEKEIGLANRSLERALELADLTIEAGGEGKPVFFLKEFLRFRELLAACYINPQKDGHEFVMLFQTFLDLDPEVHNLQLEI